MVLTRSLAENRYFLKQHAMRISTKAAFCFSSTMIVYSTCLIVVGATYKMFLFEYVYLDATSSSSASYNSTGNATSSYGDDANHRLLYPTMAARWLAAGESAALRLDKEDRRQRIAHLFSGSLALVWFCLDVVTWAHSNFEVLPRASQGRKARVAAIVLVVLRVALIGWIATVSQYETDPDVLSIMGLAGILAHLGSRALVNYLLPSGQEGEDESVAIDRMLQYNNARLRMPGIYY
jgi:uncharacterized membrane protein YeiB